MSINKRAGQKFRVKHRGAIWGCLCARGAEGGQQLLSFPPPQPPYFYYFYRENLVVFSADGILGPRGVWGGGNAKISISSFIHLQGFCPILQLLLQLRDFPFSSIFSIIFTCSPSEVNKMRMFLATALSNSQKMQNLQENDPSALFQQRLFPAVALKQMFAHGEALFAQGK